MDTNAFDHLTRLVASSGPRRTALKTLVASGAAALVAHVGSAWSEAKKDKKKRCRKLRQKCGGRKKCCKGGGLIKCREVTDPLKPECDGVSGRRCCGLDGAACSANEDNCQCCEGLRCREFPEGVFRCADVAT